VCIGCESGERGYLLNGTKQIPQDIQGLCQSLLQGLKEILADKLYGVYLYGALAFPEAGPTGDIDFHVILTKPLTRREKSGLVDLHASLARDFPPLGAELDGYYLLLRDARQTAPPPHQLLAGVKDNSWALHRAHIRAGRCIPLHGPDPKEIYPPAEWPELADALQGELDYVARHLVVYPAYCVLNLCRLMVSYATQDVVISKRASAEWAAAAFVEWSPLIAAATRSYARQATPEDQELLTTRATDFFDFARHHIGDSQRKLTKNDESER
jgi:hypothetical protein